jgi:hypothetical protein
MTTSIGGTSGFSSTSHAQMREQMFKKLDADGSGGIDETEFAAGPSGSSGSSGMDSGIASALFTAFDTDSDGSLTQDELETGFQKLSSSMRSVLIGTQEQGGSGGPGGPGGPDGPPPPPPQDSSSGSSDGSDSSLDTLLSLLQGTTSSASDSSDDDSSDSTTVSAKTAAQNDFKQLLNDLQKLVQSASTTSSTSVSA